MLARSIRRLLSIPDAEALISRNPVMVFSKTTCRYCTAAKDLLADLKVTPAVVEVDEECTLLQMAELQDHWLQTTGERTVPRVFVHGKSVGGFRDLEALAIEGKLQDMLAGSGSTKSAAQSS